MDKTARNLYDSPEFTTGEVDAFVNEKVNTKDLEGMQAARASISQQIWSTDLFNEKEKNARTQKLNNMSGDFEAIQSFKGEVEREIQDIGEIVQTGVDLLDKHKAYFHKDAGFTAEDYKKDLMKQDKAEKSHWVDVWRTKDLPERKELYTLVEEVMPGESQNYHREQIRQMRAELEARRNCQNQLKGFLARNSKYLSPTELEELNEGGSDETASEQLETITRLREELPQRQEMQRIYNALTPDYKKQWGDQPRLSLEENEAHYEKLSRFVMSQYGEKQSSPEFRMHIGAEDAKAAYDYIAELPLVDTSRTGKQRRDKITAYQSLDDQITLQEKEVTTPFRDVLKNLKKYNPQLCEQMERNFYNAPTEKARLIVTSGAEKTLEAAQAMEKELTASHDTFLTDLVQKRYIRNVNLEKYVKGWEKATLPEKQKILSKLESGKNEGLNRRVDLVLDFEELPPKLQEQHQSFYNLDYEGRTKLMSQLLAKTEKEAAQAENSELTKKPQREKTKDALSQEGAPTEVISEKDKLEEQIEELFILATRAERSEDWETAQYQYEQILELKPEDTIAARNLASVKAELAKTEDQETETGAEEEDTLEDLTDAQRDTLETTVDNAINMQEILRERHGLTASDIISEEAKGAQTENAGATRAARRMAGVDHFGKLLQQELPDGYAVGRDGELVKENWIPGWGSGVGPAELRIKATEYAREVGTSADIHHDTGVVFYDRSGGVMRAEAAIALQDKRRDQLIGRIVGQVMNADKNNQFSTGQARAVVKKQDLSVDVRELRAA